MNRKNDAVKKTQGEVRMRTTRKEKTKPINGCARIGFVLVLTIMISVLMPHGWTDPTEAQAALEYYKGTLNASTVTGNQDVTTVPFQPKAVIFYWTNNTTTGYTAGAYWGAGFSDGTNQRVLAVASNDNVATSNAGGAQRTDSVIVVLSNGTPTVDAQASFTQFLSNGFRLNWSNAAASAFIIHYVALGGTDIANVQVGGFNQAGLTAPISQTVTTGFQPDFVMFLAPERGAVVNTNGTLAAFNMGMMTETGQVSLGWGARDAQTANASVGHGQRTTHALMPMRRNLQDSSFTFTQWETTGFTINWDDAPGGTQEVFYLAIKGGNHRVGSFAKRSGTGSDPVTGVGFLPSGLMLMSYNHTAGAGATTTNAAKFSMGAGTDTTNEGSIWVQHVYNAATANTDANRSMVTGKIIRMSTSAATTNDEADLSSLDADGFTLGWTTSTTTAKELLYWAAGTACTDNDIATLATTNPASSSNVSGTVTIQAQVSTETTPDTMTGMVVNIAGSTGCNVTDGAMTWNGTSSRWEYTWNTSACGTSVADGGVTIDVRGYDPDCGGTTLVNAAQITNVTIDNTCTATAPAGLAAAAGTTTTSINLSWTSPTTGVNYYNVYRDGVKISTDGAVTTGSFSDSGPLAPSKTYAYYLRGYNTSGGCEGQASGTINKTTLAVTPASPIVTNTGTGTSVNVTIGSDANSAEAAYAIRINGGSFTDQFVQAGGSVGASAIWQTTSGWSTIAVTGLTNNTDYTFDVEARNGNGENIVSVPAFGSTTSVNVHVAAPSTLASCAGCHAYPPGDGTRSGATGSVVGSHQPHNKAAYTCAICHVAPSTETSADFDHRDGTITMQSSIQGGAYTGGTHAQINTPSPTSCSTNNCHGGAAGNTPTPTWGSGTKPQCISCHNGAVRALNAELVSGGSVTQRDAVKGEFGLAWGHKPSGKTPARAVVADADCIVCHLEGNYSTQQTSSYHADGYIDLRDPDGSGEAGITNIAGTSYRFIKFSTSYSAGTRYTDGHTREDVDNILTQKFCLACHDSNGATNTTARSNNGGTGTAMMPFGGYNLGANYTVLNGAAQAGGVVNAKTQFATTNSSVHPVLGPRNSDYPVNTRLAAPYNNIGTTRVAGAHNLANSVVLNCFDCHTTGTSLTNRTIVAHGSASTLRGTIYATSPTLCSSCHTGYTVTGNHGSGSAMASSTGRTDEGFNNNCHYCHSSGSTKPARPRPAQDYHGFNSLVSGGLWPTVNSRPYAFIRAWSGTAYHRPYRSSEFTTGSATCGAGTCPTGGAVGDGSNRTYTPGGTY